MQEVLSNKPFDAKELARICPICTESALEEKSELLFCYACEMFISRASTFEKNFKIMAADLLREQQRKYRNMHFEHIDARNRGWYVGLFLVSIGTLTLVGLGII